MASLCVCLHWHLNWASRLNTAEPFKTAHTGQIIPSTNSGWLTELHLLFLSQFFFFVLFARVHRAKTGRSDCVEAVQLFSSSFPENKPQKEFASLRQALETCTTLPTYHRQFVLLWPHSPGKKSLFLSLFPSQMSKGPRQCSRQELNKPITQPEGKRMALPLCFSHSLTY